MFNYTGTIPSNFLSNETIRVDNIINSLLRVQNKSSSALSFPFVYLSENEIFYLCTSVRELFLNESSLLELNAPLKIFGDVHGQYLDLLHWFSCAGYPSNNTFLFLGDYVDRGRQSIETICLLFAFKVKYPNKVKLLRGNHESADLNKVYGFYDECKRRYSIKLWKAFTDCFNCLPVAAIIDSKIFCCHGGISPHLYNLNQIRDIKRPTNVPNFGLLCDLLWSDPEGFGFKGWAPNNERRISYVFGVDVVQDFLQTHNLDLICRAHQVVEDGYEFFGNRSLVTIFSAPNYCGEFRNSGSIMTVDQNLICSFLIFKPEQAKTYTLYDKKNDLSNNIPVNLSLDGIHKPQYSLLSQLGAPNSRMQRTTPALLPKNDSVYNMPNPSRPVSMLQTLKNNYMLAVKKPDQEDMDID